MKLTSHMSDIFGVSGRLLLQKIVDHEVITMDFLETHMKGALRHKSPKLLQSLNSRLRAHHRSMIRMSWEHLQYIESSVAQMEAHIRNYTQDKEESFNLLLTVPGVNENAAAVIIAEIGTDMSQFKSDHSLAAWAGMSPGNHESAGKKNDSGQGPETVS
ncbi:transposase [Paenibacillus sp. BR1-192]|uniref:transposase n=1 Tax=Paenibacillus sp. BR1-192 TaxID=3032287 RepID=UPI00240D5CC3|nr:transposase [Paenibacillus sp. BR1-192]WFB59593.1 transposase [Paenibacillus sp. BR1-192]